MSDALKRKILDLIELTNDPAQKAQLLVQLQMLDLLAENTDATRQIADDVIASRRSIEEHRNEFSEHAVEELKRVSAQRGAMRVIGWGYGIIQAVVIAIGGAVYADYRETKGHVMALEQYRAAHIAHHEQEERFSAGPKVGR